MSGEDDELDERGVNLGDVFADESPDEDTDPQGGSTNASAETADASSSQSGAAEEEAPTVETTPPATSAADDVRNEGSETDAAQASKIVRESQNLNIYIAEDVYERVQRTYKELDAEYYAAHGEDLEKNREFYTALLEAGLDSDDLRERLGIE